MKHEEETAGQAYCRSFMIGCLVLTTNLGFTAMTLPVNEWYWAFWGNIPLVAFLIYLKRTGDEASKIDKMKAEERYKNWVGK